MVLTSETNILATSGSGSGPDSGSGSGCAVLCCAVLSCDLLWIFPKLFYHELIFEFIDSIDLKRCIGHWLTHPVIKKMVLTSEINI